MSNNDDKALLEVRFFFFKFISVAYKLPKHKFRGHLRYRDPSLAILLYLFSL